MTRIALILFAWAQFYNVVRATEWTVSPLKLEQSRRKAIDRLQECTNDAQCLDNNFNDILSAWWNLGTFPQNYKNSLRVMLSHDIQNELELRLEESLDCAKRGRPNCLFHLVFDTFNAKRYNIPSSLTKSINFVELKPQIQSQLVQMAPWNSRNNRLSKKMRPDPNTLDFVLVFSWAAFRVGVDLDNGWKTKDLLEWFDVLQPYPIPSVTMAASEYRHTRSLTTAVMHAIYVACEFGLASVNLEAFRAEHDYLRNAFVAANQFRDYELMGEIIDVLDVAGAKRNYKNIERLLESQNSENVVVEGNTYGGMGTWGRSAEDISNLHQHYVCTLALFERGEKRFKKQEAGQFWTNKKYWEIVEDTFPGLFSKREEMPISQPNPQKSEPVNKNGMKEMHHLQFIYSKFPLEKLCFPILAVALFLFIFAFCFRAILRTDSEDRKSL